VRRTSGALPFPFRAPSALVSMEMSMKRIVVLLALTVGAAVAEAKLPPPTPEQVAAAEARRAAEEAQLKREKAALEQAQDRVADRYRRENGAASAGSSERVSDQNMPKTARELPGQGTPQGGRRPSAEAHSAPAK
jgi:hypothetical protein